MIFAVMNMTVLKMVPENKSGLYRIWTQTSAILMQCSTNQANKPTIEEKKIVSWLSDYSISVALGPPNKNSNSNAFLNIW